MLKYDITQLDMLNCSISYNYYVTDQVPILMACNMILTGEHGFSSNLYFELGNKDRTILKTKGHETEIKSC